MFYLLARNGERPSSIGVDASEPGRDLLRGAGLAALIGGSGLISNPMIIAHTLINSVAFIGYTLLVAHVSWLP